MERGEAARRVVSLELSQPGAGCPSLLHLWQHWAPMDPFGQAPGAGCAAASRPSELGGCSRLSPTQWGTETAFSSREKMLE